MKGEQETHRWQDHEQRIAALEKLFQSKPDRAMPVGTKKTLSVHILALRDDRFFAQPQTSLEVHAALQSHYPCELKRVRTELIRLTDQKQLRKASKPVNEKKYTAYVWS